MTTPDPTEQTCGEPADRRGFFRCGKPADHTGDRHHVDFGVGSYTWGYVPTPDEELCRAGAPHLARVIPLNRTQEAS